MTRLALPALVALLVLATLPIPSAAAQGDNGAISNYVESVPGASGDKPGPGGGDGGGNPGGGSGGGSGLAGGGGTPAGGGTAVSGGNAADRGSSLGASGTVAGALLSPRARREFAARGTDGLTAAAAAERSGGAIGANGAGLPGSGLNDGRVAVPSDGTEQDRSWIGELVDGVLGTSDSGGMGIVFPILIVLGVLAGLGFGLARTRGRRFTRA